MRTLLRAKIRLPLPQSTDPEFSGSSPKRRRAEDKDEGIGSPDIWEEEKADDLRREMIELRQQLDKERSVRMMLEEQLLAPHLPLAPTHHPTVIVPAPPPPPSHHVNVVTVGHSSVISSVSTSRQNLDTIVQVSSHTSTCSLYVLYVTTFVIVGQHLCDRVYVRQIGANNLQTKFHGFVVGKSDRVYGA
ncbi:hypothetical protein AB205_0072760 [Aquarana catesbeiana]|uniref:Uncharacterized protein n=1 Tax=Aquarana catesbeiana TaxID=8400 RepID=A0A2G9NCF7_AQUCT|nr:hypothetical protein AB205_0072760 [Aquarana catesbeiana]